MASAPPAPTNLASVLDISALRHSSIAARGRSAGVPARFVAVRWLRPSRAHSTRPPTDERPHFGGDDAGAAVDALYSASTSASPRREQRLQLARDVLTLVRQVLPLARVRPHVEDERAQAIEHQLPIATPDSPLLLASGSPCARTASAAPPARGPPVSGRCRCRPVARRPAPWCPSRRGSTPSGPS